MRRLLERAALWSRDHPKVAAAIGLGATAAAGWFGGPLAARAAEKVLPVVCDVLRLCA